MLYFITGSKNKFEEVAAILPEVEQLDIDFCFIEGREYCGLLTN